jgi:hypothetical protein
MFLSIFLLQELCDYKYKLLAIPGYICIQPQTLETSIVHLAAIYISFKFL